MTSLELYLRLLAKERLPTGSTENLVKRISAILSSDAVISVQGPDLAGVAVILGPWKEPKILLMKRAERKGDPWSGQVALPGGRVQSNDKSMKNTAVRETREEMGIDLDKNSTFLGYMGLFRARTKGMRVVPSVFRTNKKLRISTNAEIASYRWVPLVAFLSEEARSLHSIDRQDTKLTFPAYIFDGYLIWGLTERIISNLVELI